MQRISSRKIRVSMRVRATLEDGTIHASSFRKKSSMWGFIQALPAIESIYLRVMYEPGCYNDATTDNPAAALDYLTAFTEKPLLDYVEAST